MKNKLFSVIIAISLALLSSFTLTACNDNETDNRNQDILAVYNLYVANAQENGTEPLSYDAWLNSIKGENGVGIEGMYVEENGDLMVKYTNSSTYVKIGNLVFNNEESLLKFVVNDGTQTVSLEGIGLHYELTIDIPSTFKGYTVTNISNNAFYENKSIKSVIIPNTVKTIGESAFYYCTQITSITFGNNVETIGNNAFINCKSLTTITLPSTITSIGDSAFNNCILLSTINFSGTKEQWNAITKGNSWKTNVPANKIICSDGEITLNSGSGFINPDWFN